jgi:predicted AlkP superfamily phosphohydrolase/phosphomutase
VVGSEQVEQISKVLVIGLDGATWDLFAPWIEEGLLPNLARLRERGVWADLQSTIPPLTAPAWLTFQTGVNPGGHGFFDFTRYQPGSYDTPVLSANDLTLPTLWRMLSDAGRRVIVINVPVTYPPELVNGLLISGMMTPNTRVQFTHPPELALELEQEVGRYPVFTPLRRVDLMGPRAFVDRLIDTIQRRAAAASYLMTHYPWDFFMVHFQSTDVVQHTLYPYLDSRHPLAKDTSPEEREYVLRFYRVLDELLGQIFAAAGPGTLCVVMSDHGFGPQVKRIYLNRLLAREGLLALRSGELGLRALAAAEAVVRRLDVFKLRRLMAARGAGDQLTRKARGLSQVSWAGTRAFALPGFVYGRLYVNLKGREAQGVVDGEQYEGLRSTISQRLLAAIDPQDGQSLFQKVLRREEVYSGPYLEVMPDLIAVPAEGYMISEAFRGDKLVDRAPSMLTGSHRPNGLLVVAGPGIRAGQHTTGTSIADLAPTILYALGVPIPGHMDGVVVREAFLPSYLYARPPSLRRGASAVEAVEACAYTPQERDAIEERLRGLGYLG